MIRAHLKLGQSTKISKNGKISKGVCNTVRKKNKNGEKVDRKSKNGEETNKATTLRKRF